MMLSNHPKHIHKGVVFRDKYNIKSTVSSTSNSICRKAIYEWKAKYDGHWKSLLDKSHRPHSHTKKLNTPVKKYKSMLNMYRPAVFPTVENTTNTQQ